MNSRFAIHFKISVQMCFEKICNSISLCIANLRRKL
jgi:hypothetical protein